MSTNLATSCRVLKNKYRGDAIRAKSCPKVIGFSWCRSVLTKSFLGFRELAEPVVSNASLALICSHKAVM